MAIADEDGDRALKRQALGYTEEELDNIRQFIARSITQSTTLKIDTQKNEETSTEVVPSEAKKTAKEVVDFVIDIQVAHHLKLSRVPSPGEFDFNNPYHGLAAYHDHPKHGRLYKDMDKVKNWPRNKDFIHIRSGTCVFVVRRINKSSINVYTLRILVFTRGGSHGAKKLALPGGHQDLGESLERCAAREVKEETSLEVKDAWPVGTTSDNFLDDAKGKKDYNTHWMVALMKDNEAEPIPETEREKVLRPRWMSLAEFEQGVRNNPKNYFYCIQQLFLQEPDICAKIVQLYAKMVLLHKPAGIPRNIQV